MTTDYITYWKQKGEYGENRINRMLARKEKRKNKASKSHTCEHCGKSFSFVIQIVENPYYAEINNMSVMERMCNDCYESACGDI